MPYRKTQFVNGDIVHTVIRAIDNNLLFKDKNDRYRGVFGIYEFNNSNPVDIRERRIERALFKQAKSSKGPPFGCSEGRAFGAAIEEEDKRDRLVDIFGFCLMPNHLHLLLRQLQEGGIVKFMSKIGTGLGSYFNKKYERKGHVFQNRFVSVPILDDDHLRIIFVYIHTNPIALIYPKWKELGIKDPQKAIKFIENYKWSSYPDCLGKKNFPSVIERDFMIEAMGGVEGMREVVADWLSHKQEINDTIKKLFSNQ